MMTGDEPRQKSIVTIDTSVFVNAVGALLLTGLGGVVTSLWSINRDVGALYAAAELAAEQNAAFVTTLAEISKKNAEEDASVVTTLAKISENNAEESLVLERLIVQMQILDARMTDLEVMPASGK